MGKVTLKIEFSGNDSGLYAAAIADFVRNVEPGDDGEPREKSTFFPGDEYHFLVQHDPRLRIVSIRTSWGAVVAVGDVERDHADDVQFADASATADLSYLVSRQTGGVQWYGNAPILRRDGRTLAVTSGPVPAIGRAAYVSAWQAFTFRPGPLELGPGEEWPVLIVIDMETVG